MSTTVTFKLNKPAQQFQAGESQGFGIRGGVQYRDPKTKTKEWTNYQAAIFTKNPNQIQFYQQVLVEGSIVEVSCEKLSIGSYSGNDGMFFYLDMLNAKIGFVHTPESQPAQGGYAQSPQQAAPQQRQPAQQQAPVNRNPNQGVPNASQGQRPAQGQGFDDFDDDIPF